MENLLICFIVGFVKENKKLFFVWRYVVGNIMCRIYLLGFSRKVSFLLCNIKLDLYIML